MDYAWIGECPKTSFPQLTVDRGHPRAHDVDTQQLVLVRIQLDVDYRDCTADVLGHVLQTCAHGEWGIRG